MKAKELIKKIISGGQTGADKGALIAAKECGTATGGCAPKGWKTEKGPDLTLCTLYNLSQSDTEDYKVRTLKNVKAADCTIIFSDKKSKGSALTEKYCEENRKRYEVISTLGDLEMIKREVLNLIVGTHFFGKWRPLIINVAGNRESKSPGIEKRVYEIMKMVLEADI